MLKSEQFDTSYTEVEFMDLLSLPLAILSLPFLFDVALLLILLVIGIAIIVIIARVLLFALPAAIIAIVVWFLTGSLFLAGVAFLIVAFISLFRRS